MNLVIDDAVEVKQATKDKEESRRQLGMSILSSMGRLWLMILQVKFC